MINLKEPFTAAKNVFLAEQDTVLLNDKGGLRTHSPKNDLSQNKKGKTIAILRFPKWVKDALDSGMVVMTDMEIHYNQKGEPYLVCKGTAEYPEETIAGMTSQQDEITHEKNSLEGVWEKVTRVTQCVTYRTKAFDRVLSDRVTKETLYTFRESVYTIKESEEVLSYNYNNYTINFLTPDSELGADTLKSTRKEIKKVVSANVRVTSNYPDYTTGKELFSCCEELSYSNLPAEEVISEETITLTFQKVLIETRAEKEGDGQWTYSEKHTFTYLTPDNKSVFWTKEVW